MIDEETIIGDDIAYFHPTDKHVQAANVECGIFGIIRDVNPEDDPVIWELLTNPGEVIISNVLIGSNNKPYWLGDGRNIPAEGINYSGEWKKGKTDDNGNELSI